MRPPVPPTPAAREWPGPRTSPTAAARTRPAHDAALLATAVRGGGPAPASPLLRANRSQLTTDGGATTRAGPAARCLSPSGRPDPAGAVAASLRRARWPPRRGRREQARHRSRQALGARGAPAAATPRLDPRAAPAVVRRSRPARPPAPAASRFRTARRQRRPTATAAPPGRTRSRSPPASRRRRARRGSSPGALGAREPHAGVGVGELRLQTRAVVLDDERARAHPPQRPTSRPHPDQLRLGPRAT